MIELGSPYANRTFYAFFFFFFCIKNYIGTQGEVCTAFKPPVVYTIDRSKAVVQMLILFCVALQFTLRGASCLVLSCSLSVCFFCPFSILITLLGEEVADLCAYRAFV